jgi:hypothetical protein
MSSSIVNLGIGVHKFEYSTNDGVAWSSIENIVEGSIAFTFSDPTETNLNVEDKADPIATLRSKDTPDRIDLSFYNLSAAEMVALAGGVATGEDWAAPISTPLINLAVRITTEPFNGYYVQYVIKKAQILAKLAGAPSKKQAEQVNISCIIQAYSANNAAASPFHRIVTAGTPA